MEDPDSDSLTAAMEMEVSTSSESPRAAAIPSRITGIGEGEIHRLIRDLEGLSTSIGKLTQGLEKLSNPLVTLSESEDPSTTAKCWTNQVRKLCHDTGDYLYDFIGSGNDFKLLEARALNASERFVKYKIQPETPSKSVVVRRLLPAPHADLIHHGDMVDEVAKLMGPAHKDLRVVAIVGPEGIGKTTLAKRLYQSVGGNGTIECCRAFLRASPNPDIRRLLTSMFMQIQRKRPSCRLKPQRLIHTIAKYLQNRRYFIIIDDLWTAAVWEIIVRAFPDGDCGSRVIIITQIEGVALACCGRRSKYVFNMVPLSDVQSRNLFFGIVFGSESDCPGDLVEVSDGIIKKCGRLPLATINIVSMLPSALNLEQWTGLRDSLPSTWSANRTSEWMKEVVNLMFSTLRPHLKTCLLYFSMYPEGYIVRKDDLIKQWVVEGVLDSIEGQATEEVAGDYFCELVRRGMIQPVEISNNGEVLSCTLHHIIHDVIVNKSMEENFVIIADHFQSAIPLPDKVRRLSVQFGSARNLRLPESIMVSEVRSLAFFGFLRCFSSASTAKYTHVRILILHIWADEDKDAFDLTGIRELLRLRYLKISCNIAVKLPDDIQGQRYLETLELHATVVAIPWDIGGLSRLSTLKIAVRELLSNDIIFLQQLPALTTLSVNVKTAPSEMIVIDEGGFLNLRFFTFICSAPRLLIAESAMCQIQKLHLCFNAPKPHEDGTRHITIQHLPSLKEISVKIGGAVADASSSTWMNTVTSDSRNPTPILQLIDSRGENEHGTLEEEDAIIEEDTHETEEKGLEECENSEEDCDGTQDDGLGKDHNENADSRVSMLTESSSRLPLSVAAVGWGIATAGWILSPVFTRLVHKALPHMEPGESKDNLSKLVADHIIPRLELTVETAESGEDKEFFEKLIRELKSNFYELEEILDEVEYDRLESHLTGQNKREHASIDDAGPSNQSIVNKSSEDLTDSVKKRLTKNLKMIEEALEEVRDNIKLEKLPSDRSTEHRLEVKDRRKTTYGEPLVQVIGRDQHIKQITDLLHNRKSGANPSLVIGIYGIAGSGKTALAQHVYQSAKKASQNGKRPLMLFMWIHVSRDFSVAQIFREMLQQFTGNRNRNPDFSLEALRTELKGELRSRTFLLVLDDIWCDKDSDKYKLYELFSLLTQVCYNRSKILVTSRDKNALSSIGYDVQATAIEIQDLNEKDFFNLFMYHAFRGKMADVIVKEELKGIGVHIAKRLKGLPLAATLVGGLLHKEMTLDHWISVKDDPYLLKGIMGIMWLCYKHLDEQARRCFAYCSFFPRRHCFERAELVKLWVAEGFIEATDARQMEEIGTDYFGELVSGSFMQLGEKDSNGGKEYFLVHDLLHDIAEQVGGSDCFRIENGRRSGEVPLDVRHLFVQTSYRFLMKDVVKLEKLRTLIIINGENSIGSEEVFNDMLENKRLRKLRVLVIKTTALRGYYLFPESIVQSKHMRYLAFRSRLTFMNFRISIPVAFTKLYHMQVLDFGYDIDLSIFSAEDMLKLRNLRHLTVEGKVSNINWLTSLENLPFFTISKDMGCEIFQLSRLDKLRGKLHISHLDSVRSKDEALLARLADKKRLRQLVLKWGDSKKAVNEQVPEVQADVLEGLCPSEYLEELEIINYNGDKYPNWMVDDIHPSWRVRRLVLKECSPLRAIPPTTPFFANLLRLTFQFCEWDALPDYMEHLEKLTVLIIEECWEIKSLGELPRSLKYLEIYKCAYDFMEFCKNDPNWNKKTDEIERKFIGYPRLQDPSQYPDDHGVFSPDSDEPMTIM